MKIELTKEELALVMDGLSKLPLHQVYQLFNRLWAIYQAPELKPNPEDGEF